MTEDEEREWLLRYEHRQALAREKEKSWEGRRRRLGELILLLLALFGGYCILSR
jgi:hypothetical protein